MFSVRMVGSTCAEFMNTIVRHHTLRHTPKAKCWICGNEADSGEHIPKASDLKSYFGVVTSKKPIYQHVDPLINRKINGINSKRLKSATRLCANCNNSLTQCFDNSWVRLSEYMVGNAAMMFRVKYINMSKVFLGATRRNALNVHLYFVKLFGCKLLEENPEIDITSFSKSILQKIPHPSVYFVVCPTPVHFRFTNVSSIEYDSTEGLIRFAAWTYTLAPVTVRIEYADSALGAKPSSCAWHPSRHSKILKIGNYYI